MRGKWIDSVSVVFVVLVCMTGAGLDFNPAARIHIADRVFPNIEGVTDGLPGLETEFR